MSIFKKEVKSKGKYIEYLDKGKEDISLKKLVGYNLLFFVPIFISLTLSNALAKRLGWYLQVGPTAGSQIFMILFTFIIFFMIIPFIRQRENVKGVRLSLFGFLIVAVFMAVPSMFIGEFGFLFRQFIPVGTYLMLVFIFCPEVLGITGNVEDWFKKGKQVVIITIYTAIVLFYTLGFGWIYYDISSDPVYPAAFATPNDAGAPTANDMFYYSIITFATIGYGDITPVSNAARLVAGIEAMVGMLINVLFIAILLVYVSNFQAFAAKQEEKRIKQEEEEVKREEKKVEDKVEEVEREILKIEGEEKMHDDVLEELRKNKVQGLNK